MVDYYVTLNNGTARRETKSGLTDILPNKKVPLMEKILTGKKDEPVEEIIRAYNKAASEGN